MPTTSYENLAFCTQAGSGASGSIRSISGSARCWLRPAAGYHLGRPVQRVEFRRDPGQQRGVQPDCGRGRSRRRCRRRARPRSPRSGTSKEKANGRMRVNGEGGLNGFNTHQSPIQFPDCRCLSFAPSELLDRPANPRISARTARSALTRSADSSDIGRPIPDQARGMPHGRKYNQQHGGRDMRRFVMAGGHGAAPALFPAVTSAQENGDDRRRRERRVGRDPPGCDGGSRQPGAD